MEQLSWIIFTLTAGLVCIVGLTAVVVIARCCIDILIQGLQADLKMMKQLEDTPDE